MVVQRGTDADQGEGAGSPHAEGLEDTGNAWMPCPELKERCKLGRERAQEEPEGLGRSWRGVLQGWLLCKHDTKGVCWGGKATLTQSSLCFSLLISLSQKLQDQRNKYSNGNVKGRPAAAGREGGRSGGGADMGRAKALVPQDTFLASSNPSSSSPPWLPPVALALPKGIAAEPSQGWPRRGGRQDGGAEDKGADTGWRLAPIKRLERLRSSLRGRCHRQGARRNARSLPAKPGAGRQRRLGRHGGSGPVLGEALRLREVRASGCLPVRPRRLVPAGAAFLRGSRGDPRFAAPHSLRLSRDCASGSLLLTLLPQVALSPCGCGARRTVQRSACRRAELPEERCDRL